jgi:formate hydrogenlyase subunit 6/NADH:ubiquinone oxidoreductase subunit I
VGLARMLPELLHSLFAKPATLRFPFEPAPAPEGMRGKPVCDLDSCIGCRSCQRDCPAAAIDMVNMGDRLPKPVFHYDRCAFCGQCSDSCPKKCISMTHDYDLACDSREALVSPIKMKVTEDAQ